MKQKARKLLSLLMAFAIVCSMIPAALAADPAPANTNWDGAWSKDCTAEAHDPDDGTVDTAATCGADGFATRTCKTCQATQTGTIPATGQHTPGSTYESNSTHHWHVCTVCKQEVDKEAHDLGYNHVTATTHMESCPICGYAATVAHSYDSTGTCACGAKKPATATDITVSPAALNLTVGDSASITATLTPAGATDTIEWGTSNTGVATVSGGTVTAAAPGTATITAKVSDTIKATCSVTVTAVVNSITLNPTTLTLNKGESATLTATTDPAGAAVTWTSDNTDIASVNGSGKVTAVKAGTATITATAGKKTAACTVTVTDRGISIKASKTTLTSLNDEATLTVSATGFPTGTAVDTSKTTWSVTSGSSYVNLSKSTGASVTAYPVAKGKATITASLTVDGKTYTATQSITVSYAAEVEAEAMVYNTNPGYALGELDDDGDDSIEDQIAAAVRSVSGKKESLYYVTFDTLKVSGKGSLDASTKYDYYYDEEDAEAEKGELLSDVVFTPVDDYEGDVSFEFKAYYDDGKNDYYTGIMTFNVKKGEAATGGDILYLAQKGDDVELDAKDFEDFWNDEYSKGELEYVVFTSVSSGTLYDADDDKLAKDEECYVEPGKRETALDGVYFTPKKNFTGAVTIGFTATGTTKSTSSTTSDLKGSVLILYTDGEVSDIDYQISANAAVTLDDADFTAIYKEATDTTSKTPTVYIRFLEVPKNGTLYYNYNSKTGKGTELKSTNISRYFFSNKSSASYGIEDVTYVANSKGTADSIQYAAYSSSSSGSLQYIGTINFGGTSSTPVTVSLNCTSTSLRFQSSTFYAGTSLLTTSSYIVFGTPTSGTLYKNYTGATGTRVTSADHFAYSASSTLGVQALSTLTYVPVTGYTGVVEIPFTSYNISGGTTSGTVRINVTAVRVTFSDLSTTNWAYQYVAPLAASGVINGYEDGTFRPANNVTYAEILKMVMLATGYSEQARTGSHWASGYMSRAITDGILSGQVSLDSAADRNAVAAIVAKAMKLSPITTGYNPFADSTDGYARALYNAGIITGYVENNTTYYKGSTLISRAEIATIIYRVSNAYQG